MAANFILTALACIAIVLVLLFNVLFIITFVKRKRMRTPARLPVNMLLLNLAAVDVIAALLWSSFTAVASALDKWVVTDGLCNMQVWIMGFCIMNCTHTLCLLMFERFLKVVKPSKHREIFFDVNVVLMLGAVWLFDAVMATFPVLGWGTTTYFTNQYQCAIDDELSVSHMDFSTAMRFGIPGVLSIIFYIAINVRLCVLRNALKPGELMVLEERKGMVKGDAYSDRLNRQYETFKISADGRRQTAKLGKTEMARSNDGYKSDSDGGSSDSDSQDDSRREVKGDNETRRKMRPEPRKLHFLSRDDVVLVHVLGGMCLMYYVFWLPYLVWSYIWVYQPTVSLPNAFLVTAVIYSHFGPAIHAPLLLIYPKYRAAVFKTLRREENMVKVEVNTSREPPTDHAERTTEL